MFNLLTLIFFFPQLFTSTIKKSNIHLPHVLCLGRNISSHWSTTFLFVKQTLENSPMAKIQVQAPAGQILALKIVQVIPEVVATEFFIFPKKLLNSDLPNKLSPTELSW